MRLRPALAQDARAEAGAAACVENMRRIGFRRQVREQCMAGMALDDGGFVIRRSGPIKGGAYALFKRFSVRWSGRVG